VSHINPLASFKTYQEFGAGFRMFYGSVVSNEDKRLLGRVKVKVPELLPWDDKDMLPWIYPLFPAGLGEGPLSSNFQVPEEDSKIIIIFPYKSIYFGYYAWHTTDRQNRQQDFHSEYPQRYGWQDSLENKKIVNKDERVNTIEHRLADGTLRIQDSKDSTYLYTDFFGTHLYVDRKNQSMTVDFAGNQIVMSKEGIRMKAPSIILDTDACVIRGKDGVAIDAPYVSVNGKVMDTKKDVGNE